MKFFEHYYWILSDTRLYVNKNQLNHTFLLISVIATLNIERLHRWHLPPSKIILEYGIWLSTQAYINTKKIDMIFIVCCHLQNILMI